MSLGSSPRAWWGAVSWHVRGLFATEDNRRVGFAARELWQPAEIEARRGVARELATTLLPELRLDRDAGYMTLPSSAMPSVEAVCKDGRAIIDAASADAGESAGNKQFFRFRVATEEQRLRLIALALDPRMLAMAASYLGVLPVITEADFFSSFPVTGPFTKSQLWHCDDDARDVLKIFVYCDRVEPADGPFELIEPTTSRRVRDAIGYRYAGRRYRVSDETMSRYVPDQQIVPILGDRGTAFVVDTVRCFHRGSRIVAPDRRRIAAMICYCPPSGITLPRRLARGTAPMAKFIPSFRDPLAQAVLGGALASRWV